MKPYIEIFLISLIGCSSLTSCNDYIDILPKGSLIPETLTDFEAFLRYENGTHTPIANAQYLLNDRYVYSYYRNTPDLRLANFMWDESANRVELNYKDEDTYYRNYTLISNCNLVLENAPTATECTDEERTEVMAYAKTIRAFCYYNLVNFYSKQYNPNTADTDGGVPVIESANLGSPFVQESVSFIYNKIIEDVTYAMNNGLPEESMTIMHPNKAAAYTFLARVYLTMGDYEKALAAANEALSRKDNLFDWVAYYEKYKAQINDPTNYSTIPDPMGFNYEENYYYRHGENYSSFYGDFDITVERAAMFEDGDAKFLCRWKYKSTASDTYYSTTLSKGYYNFGGFTTSEAWLIKAECLARTKSSMQEAMDVLNEFRKTRIIKEKYTELTAQNLGEALQHIRKTKDNELILTIAPFADARRYNAEGTYANTRIFEKEYNGKKLTLSPNSHMWVMPFPAKVIKNPGNGVIVQNVDK